MSTPIICRQCGSTGKVAKVTKDLACPTCRTGAHLDLHDEVTTPKTASSFEEDRERVWNALRGATGPMQGGRWMQASDEDLKRGVGAVFEAHNRGWDVDFISHATLSTGDEIRQILGLSQGPLADRAMKAVLGTFASLHTALFDDPSGPMALLPKGTPDQDRDMDLVDPDRPVRVTVPEGSAPYTQQALTSVTASSDEEVAAFDEGKEFASKAGYSLTDQQSFAQYWRGHFRGGKAIRDAFEDWKDVSPGRFSSRQTQAKVEIDPAFVQAHATTWARTAKVEAPARFGEWFAQTHLASLQAGRDISYDEVLPAYTASVRKQAELLTVTAWDLYQYAGRMAKDAGAIAGDLRILESATRQVRGADRYVSVKYEGYQPVDYDPEAPFIVALPGDPMFYGGGVEAKRSASKTITPRQAAFARIAARVQKDNPHLDPASVRTVAKKVIARYPVIREATRKTAAWFVNHDSPVYGGETVEGPFATYEEAEAALNNRPGPKSGLWYVSEIDYREVDRSDFGPADGDWSTWLVQNNID